MKTSETVALEAQIAALQGQINYLKSGGMAVKPVQRLQIIRRECREKYFGTLSEMQEGKIQYGPNGKSYSDYSAIMDIISKMSGLLFKYSYGKASGSVQIASLLASAEDEARYKEICDKVCKGLKNGILAYSGIGSRREGKRAGEP